MNVAALTLPQHSRVFVRIGWALLLMGAIFAAVNAVLFMTVEGHGGAEFKARLHGQPLAGWSHTMGGSIAVLIGPFQFLSAVRNRYRQVHVWMGRVYLSSVLVGGLAGLYFAPTSVGGDIGAAGFIGLAMAWSSWVPNLLIVEAWIRRKQNP